MQNIGTLTGGNLIKRKGQINQSLGLRSLLFLLRLLLLRLLLGLLLPSLQRQLRQIIAAMTGGKLCCTLKIACLRQVRKRIAPLVFRHCAAQQNIIRRPGNACC